MQHVRIELPADRHTGRADALVWSLIAGLPVLFALATWDPAAESAFQSVLKFFSIPVIAIEAATVFYAMRFGFSPLAAVRGLPVWMRAALAVLVAIAFLTASLVAPDPGTATTRTTASFIHLLFGLSLAWLMTSRWTALRPLVWPSIVAGTCVFTLMVAAFVPQIDDPATFNWLHFGLAVINVRQLGFYSAVGAAAALGLAAVRPGGRAWIGWTTAASLLLALSFWSGTRGSLIAVIAAFAGGLLFIPALRTVRAVSAVALSFVAGGLLSLVHLAPDPHFGLLRMSNTAAHATADELSSGRLSMWAGTVRIVVERPLFGWGESQFRLIVPEALGQFNHPHNFVLQLLLQWGIVGALCVFALGAPLVRRCWQGLRTKPDESAPALLVSGALLTMALYEGSLYHPYPIVMTIVALVFLLTVPRTARTAGVVS